MNIIRGDRNRISGDMNMTRERKTIRADTDMITGDRDIIKEDRQYQGNHEHDQTDRLVYLPEVCTDCNYYLLFFKIQS